MRQGTAHQRVGQVLRGGQHAAKEARQVGCVEEVGAVHKHKRLRAAQVANGVAQVVLDGHQRGRARKVDAAVSAAVRAVAGATVE